MAQKMQVTNQQYVRKGHVIKNMAGDVVFTGSHGAGEKKRPSINAAKRHSRELQGSRLGCGLLRVAV